MAAVLFELEPWWLYVTFLSLQFFLSLGIDLGWTRARIWLDRRHPDDLPLTTGEWTQAKLKELGANDVSVVQASGKHSGIDGYLPSARLIMLAEQTYAKNDVSFWAVGAHEIGHALTYRRSLIFSGVERITRIVRDSLVGGAATMMFANMWYRLPQVTAVAHGLFIAVLVCDLIVMIDEAQASLFARKLLRDEPRLTSAMRATASLTLIGALATYVGAFVGRVILVAEWQIVSDAITRKGPHVSGPALSGQAAAVVAVLSVLVLAWGVRWAVRWFAKREPTPFGLRSMATGAIYGALVFVLLYLIWDQPFGLVYVASCIAALYSTRATVVALLLPLLIPFTLVSFFIAVAILAVVLASKRRNAPLGGAGATSATTSPVRWEAVGIFACWPMIITFWILWLSSR